MELLSPAGSMEAVTAAVQNGADAVYFGYGDFNARRGARNLSPEEAAAAVSYCHLRGCRVNLTLNTLLTDRELPAAAELAAHASDIGVDAVIVQDLGAVRMLRQSVPELPIHGSTQMTVHSLDGVKLCADLGMTRVVLGRELSRDQIAYICQNSPIEIEVFGHGALCMCWSGQCFFSSVIGGRSGNRGMCAQPCRLNYGWNGKANEYPLSLKDLSLAGHLGELRDMGVACLKLEGRMKRPEYVAIVTGIYARALKEDREPTAEELDILEKTFSRQGFTEGYFMGKRGPDMFGTRQEEKEPKELYAQARATYESGENRKEPVRMYALIEAGQPAQAAAEDRQGHVVRAEGPVPEPARNVPLTQEKVEGQLQRTGGTPFVCEKAVVRVEEGLSLPLSALNDMRRRCLEELSRQRQQAPKRRREPFQPGVRYDNPKQPPVFTLSVRTAGQLSTELLTLKPALVYLPAGEGAAHPEAVDRCRKAGVPVAAILPRICTDAQLPRLEGELIALREAGVDQALAGAWGAVRRAQRLGFQVRGDYGLGVYNSQTMKELKRLGLISATVSFEMKFPQIRDISKTIPMEFIAYGRLPLMITENCIIHNHSGQHTCGNVNLLTDRKGERFPVVQAWGCRNEILNSKKLFLADKARDWQKLGLWAGRLVFTTENALECVQVLERYLGRGKYQPNDFTRGLYYRDVE
ncbi:U32 family peptidase [Pseudoflavonifractor sp. 60]|uniref:U32 family peptidase n=1 Tax=Pseudoflavonifractor sp. 60 TaxID=2304576 RepID=UPI00136881D5|nr:U32 family peptidase [Pseudoflavonifractor sp. 60]NBI67541.1 U32 family peptidase [Pseudoflavonifractor sp. 60]